MARTIARQVVFEPGDGARRCACACPRPPPRCCAPTTPTACTFVCSARAASTWPATPTLPVPDEPAALDELHFRDDEIHAEPVRVAYLWVQRRRRRRRAVAGAGGRDAGQALATDHRDHQGRHHSAVRDPAGGGVPGLARAGARHSRRSTSCSSASGVARSEDLSPIDEFEAPEEVAPLVRAINDLLARLDQSIGTQKHFLADAAHQLKTPLAGLRTQAELAQREIDAGQQDPRSLKRSLQQIAHSSQRAAHMVNQLLAMARAEDKESALRKQEVRLSRLAREVVRDFVPRAMDKHIDLGYEGPDDDDGADAADRPAAADPRADPQPGGQRAAVHAGRRRGDGARDARSVRPGGGAAGRGLRARHRRGRTRAGVPAVLPRARHAGRRQRPRAGDRQGDRHPPRHHGRGGRRAAARPGLR